MPFSEKYLADIAWEEGPHVAEGVKIMGVAGEFTKGCIALEDHFYPDVLTLVKEKYAEGLSPDQSIIQACREIQERARMHMDAQNAEPFGG